MIQNVRSPIGSLPPILSSILIPSSWRTLPKRKAEWFRMGSQHPKSIEEAVQLLLTELSEKDQEAIRNMAEEEVSSLHLSLGNYIRDGFALWENNEELLKACCPDGSLSNADDASMVIIKALWWKLQPVQ